MVTASDLLDEGMLFVVTVQGGMIGRETRNDLVIPVPDINVSKVGIYSLGLNQVSNF